MLLRQWIEETKKHAPSLNYIVYEGYGDIMQDWLDRDIDKGKETVAKRKRELVAEAPEKTGIQPRKGEKARDFFQRWYDNWIKTMGSIDVVFVTYDTLGKDLDVALAPIIRPRRAAAGPPREKVRSVLLMCQYWRVSQC
jgi:E3 ubiquitin-protein ligase SHPRH